MRRSNEPVGGTGVSASGANTRRPADTARAHCPTPTNPSRRLSPSRPPNRPQSRPGRRSASVPERRYDLAGSLLAAAIAEGERSGAPIAECLSPTARAAGRVIGEEAAAATGPLTKRDDRRRAVLEILARHGYEPVSGKRGEIALVNCPFHRLAEEHRSLVCGMNLDFLGGLLDGIGPTGRLDARLAPEPGYCCVRIKAA